MTMEVKRSRPTLQDIADRVGITKMTVSRYMRNPDSVAQATRDKIAQVVEELGYIHNRRLQCCRSHQVKRLVFYCHRCQTKYFLASRKVLSM